jgi:hypothetical protein
MRTRERSSSFPKLAKHNLESAYTAIGLSHAQVEAIRNDVLSSAETDHVPEPQPPPPGRATGRTSAEADALQDARGVALDSERSATVGSDEPDDETHLRWMNNSATRDEIQTVVAATAAVAPVPLGWLLRCALLLGLTLPGHEHMMWMAEALWAHRRVPFGWIERQLPDSYARAAGAEGLPSSFYESPLEGRAHWLHPVHLRLRAAARAQMRVEQLAAAGHSASRRGSGAGRLTLATASAALSRSGARAPTSPSQ